MNMIKDKKIIALSIILVVFTICYFIIANKVSYAFVTDYDANATYDNVIDTIKKSAMAYGTDKTQLFDENNTIYIKVQELIDEKYLVPNEEGNIENPLEENETLNSKMIKIKKEEDKITVEVDS